MVCVLESWGKKVKKNVRNTGTVREFLERKKVGILICLFILTFYF